MVGGNHWRVWLVICPAIITSHAGAQGDAALAKPDPKPVSKLVYKSDFGNVVVPKRWSEVKTANTPLKNLPFMGEFGSYGAVTLSLSELPAHQYLRFKCKLYVLMSHDGNDPVHGPDNFFIGGDGSWLLNTTFSNHFMLPKNAPRQPLQAFPDEFPAGQHLPATGASEKGTLGYEMNLGDAGKAIGDSVYDLELVFPHRDPEVELRFKSSFAESIANESYGIAGVEVQAISGPVPRTDVELEALWIQLAGEDPIKAHAALWDLVASGEPALELVARKVRELRKASDAKALGNAAPLAAEFDRLLLGLQSDEFVARQRAQTALFKMGPDILPLVAKKLQGERNSGTRSSLLRLAAKLRQLKRRAEQVGAQQERLLDSRIHHYLRVAAGASPRAQELHAGLLAETNGLLDENGKIHLQSRNAILIGKGTRPIVKNDNGMLELWNNEQISLRWQLRDIKPGKYELSIVNSCRGKEAGSTYKVTVGEKVSLAATVTDSGGWQKKATTVIGSVEIVNGDKPLEVILRPIEKQGAWVMNFGELILSPKPKPN